MNFIHPNAPDPPQGRARQVDDSTLVPSHRSVNPHLHNLILMPVINKALTFPSDIVILASLNLFHPLHAPLRSHPCFHPSTISPEPLHLPCLIIRHLLSPTYRNPVAWTPLSGQLPPRFPSMDLSSHSLFFLKGSISESFPQVDLRIALLLPSHIGGIPSRSHPFANLCLLFPCYTRHF